jgi:hypothetical protein
MNNKLSIILILLFTFIALCGLAVNAEQNKIFGFSPSPIFHSPPVLNSTQSSCNDNGKIYDHNTVFKSSDSCNVCKCFNSTISCTSLNCLLISPTITLHPTIKPEIMITGSNPKPCLYQGKEIQDGEYADPPCNSIACVDGIIYESARPCQIDISPTSLRFCTVPNTHEKIPVGAYSDPPCNSCQCKENGTIACYERPCMN